MSEVLTANPSTPSPTCSISPAHSNPKINGHLGGESIAPCLTIKSWKLRPLKPKQKFKAPHSLTHCKQIH